MALKLRKLGLTRVRPLEGGFFGWKEKGFPLEDYADLGQAAAVGE